jgi:transcriptional regulator GlxA family with amidase domain
MSARLLAITDWEAVARRAEFEPARMAGICLASMRQLERFFADHHAQTPERWVMQFRLRLAKELLAKGFTTKAVAAELKFADASHFCKAFKRFCGISPQAFAAKMSIKYNNVA